MCAPLIIDAVRQEISRRRFLGTVSGAVGAAMATAAPLGAQQPVVAKPVRLPKGFRDVFDLTHTYSSRLPVYPAFKPVQIRQKFFAAKDGFNANELTLDEHTGTHLDAPIHFVPNAITADRLPADRFVAPLVVISIAARADRDADALLMPDDVMSWEKQHGRIPDGAFVAMHSGWDARIGDPKRFLNMDARSTMHAPGFSGAAATLLVQQRQIVGAGVDTLSLDAGAVPKPVAHLAFLGAGKYGVELLANLATLPPAGATIIIGGPKHEHATGGPCRVFALV